MVRRLYGTLSGCMGAVIPDIRVYQETSQDFQPGMQASIRWDVSGRLAVNFAAIRSLDCYRTQLYGGRKWFKRNFDVALGSERHFHGGFRELVFKKLAGLKGFQS